VQIDKQTIIDLIREHGDADQAGAAHQELPETVDTDEHAGALERFGLTQEALTQHLPGRLGKLL
jgi:hypothetical protein